MQTAATGPSPRLLGARDRAQLVTIDYETGLIPPGVATTTGIDGPDTSAGLNSVVVLRGRDVPDGGASGRADSDGAAEAGPIQPLAAWESAMLGAPEERSSMDCFRWDANFWPSPASRHILLCGRGHQGVGHHRDRENGPVLPVLAVSIKQ